MYVFFPYCSFLNFCKLAYLTIIFTLLSLFFRGLSTGWSQFLYTNMVSFSWGHFTKCHMNVLTWTRNASLFERVLLITTVARYELRCCCKFMPYGSYSLSNSAHNKTPFLPPPFTIRWLISCEHQLTFWRPYLKKERST